MTSRKGLLYLKSLAPYIHKASNYESTLIKNLTSWRQGQNSHLLASNFVHITNIQLVQNYTKSRDKPKNHGKKKIEFREDILSEYFNVDKIRLEMNDVIEYIKEQFLEHVSVRNAIGAIESIPILFESTEYTIRDLAQINRKNPKTVVMNFSAFPQTIPLVLETLQKSDLNLNPQQDGTTIFIPVPKVTREHREKLAKSANALFIKCKAAVKEVQIKFNKKLDMRTVNEKISVEQLKVIQEQLTLLADSYVSQLEKIKDDKVKELLRD